MLAGRQVPGRRVRGRNQDTTLSLCQSQVKRQFAALPPPCPTWWDNNARHANDGGFASRTSGQFFYRHDTALKESEPPKKKRKWSPARSTEGVNVSDNLQPLELGTQCLHQFTQRNGIELVLGHESPRLRMLAGIRTQSGEVRTSDEGTYSSVTSLPLGEGTNTTRRLRLSPPLTEART